MKKIIVFIIMLAVITMQAAAYVTEPLTVYDGKLGMYETKVYTDEAVTLKAYSGGEEAESVSKLTSGGGYIGIRTKKDMEYKLFRNGTEIIPQSFDYTADFTVTGTSANSGYSPQEKLYFEFSEPILQSSIGSIKVYANGKEENVTVSAAENRIEISRAKGLFAYNTDFKVDLSELCDLLERKLEISVYEFKSCDVSENFSVYQEAKVFSQAGIGGFAMLAELSGDTVFHFSRKTQIPKSEALPFVPSCYAKIYDPNGRLAYIYDFTYSETGTEIREVSLPYMEGIWQIQFISGREKDILGIGISNAESWGVRGETILGITETTLKSSYVYVAEKADSMIVSSTAGSSFKIYAEDGTPKGTSGTVSGKTFARTNCEISNISADEVYRIELDEYFRDGIIVDRIPSLMCPTAEMARTLKGGWEDADGIIVQGAVQKNMRKEALRLLREKNLNVSAPQKPQQLPNIENPVAESLMFGSYGLVSPVGDQIKRQVTDPSSPYLGRFLTTAEYNSGNMVSWETGNYNAWGSTAFGALAATNAELNYFYENEALINRSALSILGSLAALSEDFIIREGNDAANYPTTHGNFYFSWISKCYAYIRDYLDEQTKNTIDLGISALCDKQGNYRGMRVNNQWMFTVTAVEAVSRSVGENRHLDFAKRHIRGLANGSHLGWQGQSSAGYYIENNGCDGSYHNLNRQLIYTMYKEHKASENADGEILAMLSESIKKNVEFASLFWVTQPEYTDAYGPNCFTTRTDAAAECIDHMAYPAIADEFPLAKRRFEVQNMPKKGFGGAGTFPYYVNNDEWAMRLINRYWTSYENGTRGYSSNGSPQWYEVLKNRDNCTAEPLPCEYESGIWEKPGIIAVKHKGIYFNVFYAFPESISMPEKSYMGGGITMLWSEPTGTVVASEKHKNYPNVRNADDIRATCVYGENENGGFIFNGKGKAELEWLENGKSFEISESIPNSSASVAWTYTLLEDCVEMKVKASGITNGAVNIPIKKTEEKAVVTSDENAVYYTYRNEEVAFSSENECSVIADGNISKLRVKLDGNNEARIMISAQLTGGLQIAEENGGDVTLLNGNAGTKNTDVYYVEYDKKGRITSAEKRTVSVKAHEYKKIYITDGKRIFIWDENMSPVQRKGMVRQ